MRQGIVEFRNQQNERRLAIANNTEKDRVLAQFFVLLLLQMAGEIDGEKVIPPELIVIIRFSLPHNITLPDNNKYQLSLLDDSRVVPRIVIRLFPHTVDLIEHTLNGHIDAVRYYVEKNPEFLLQKGRRLDHRNRRFEGTPLQAAIVANDAEACEEMTPYFARLATDLKGDAIDGLAEMRRQMKEIYVRSLQDYCEMQEEKIKSSEDERTIQLAEKRLKKYSDALKSDDLDEIMRMHSGTKIFTHATLSATAPIPATFYNNPIAKESIILCENRAISDVTAYYWEDDDIHHKTFPKSDLCTPLPTRMGNLSPALLKEITLACDLNCAQDDNTFPFELYIDALCRRSQAYPAESDAACNFIIADTEGKTREEIAQMAKNAGVAFTQSKEARDKALDELTVIEIFNRFREEYDEYIKKYDMIDNSFHILEALRQNDWIWNEVNARNINDPRGKMKSIVCLCLVGWTQRRAAEPVKQDIRQGPCFLMTDSSGKEPRKRPSRFNVWENGEVIHNVRVDVSLADPSLVDGLGIKFALCALVGSCRDSGIWTCFFVFKTYIEQKQQAGRHCYAASASASMRP